MNLDGRREDGSTTLATLDGDTVHGNFFGQSSFAAHALVAAKDVVGLGDHAPLELCGPHRQGRPAALNPFRWRFRSVVR